MDEQFYYFLIVLAYLIVCLLVSIEAERRNHSFLWTFIVCVLCSPLIGAIMFSPYKK